MRSSRAAATVVVKGDASTACDCARLGGTEAVAPQAAEQALGVPR